MNNGGKGDKSKRNFIKMNNDGLPLFMPSFLLVSINIGVVLLV